MHHTRPLIARLGLAVALCFAACAPVDGSDATEAAVAAATTTSTTCASLQITCNSGAIYLFPTSGTTTLPPRTSADPSPANQFVRSCSVDADCALAYVPQNLCGWYRAYGINRNSTTVTQSMSDYCTSRYAPCSTTYKYTVTAEDGRTASAIYPAASRCCEGTCISYVSSAPTSTIFL